jgi:S1-C subfamily serine protease
MSKKSLFATVVIMSVIAFFAGRVFFKGENPLRTDFNTHAQTMQAQSPQSGVQLPLPGDELPPPQSMLGVIGIAAFVVEDVSPGSPAEQAGLKSGDLVTWVNGNPVNSITDVLQISRKSPGHKVELFVLRYNRDTHQRDPVTVSVTTVPLKATE